MPIKIKLIIPWGLFLLAACQAIPTESSQHLEETSSPAPISPSQGGTIMSPSPSIPDDARLQALIQTTKEDLAEMAEVEWSDSSMDCPQPDMNDLQVITPGYRIVF